MTNANSNNLGSGYTSYANAAPSSGALTWDAVENYWIQAGGSPQAASMAAAIADSESGLNPNATRTNPDGTTGVGLWLLPSNGNPPGTTDPLANARAAIMFSSNGTDWSQWCTAWSDNNCGCSGGSYLGAGSNALMALGGGQGEQYNVIGSAPSGSGTSASTATGSATTTGSSSHTLLLIGLLVVLGIILYFWIRKGQRPVDETGSGRVEVNPEG